ncbi:MAG: tetratricopeptide repeat protein [Trueperaceae bacterium]|nr:tetratricopeptide repeat protein [Trueperaceae bacterium]
MSDAPPRPVSEPLVMTLLGPPTASYRGDALEPPTQKVLALLAYLSLQPRYVSRDTLSELLWGPGRARNLRQALYRMRSLGGSEVWLSVDEGRGLRVHADTDLGRVEAALAESRFDEAFAIWHDEAGQPKLLLEGLEPREAPDFLDWLDEQRSRLDIRYLDALQRHAEALEEAGRDSDALDVVDTLIARDPLNESAHRNGMQLCCRLGRPREALGRYERCRRTLAAELAVEPLPETINLARNIEQNLQDETGAAPARFQIPANILRPPLLAGREQEWAALTQAWLVRQVIFLRAPAGSGKTRLMHDFVADKGSYLQSEGRPGDGAVPFASYARWLRRLLKLGEVRLEPWVRQGLAPIIPRLSNTPSRPIETREEKIRLFEAVAQVVAQVTPGHAALVVDDLHLYDAASFEAHLYLLNKLVPSSLNSTIIATLRSLHAYRPDELEPALESHIDAMVEAGTAVRIDLGALGEEAVAALLRGLELPATPTLSRALQQHTGGNPLFIVESLKSMLEAGGLGNGFQNNGFQDSGFQDGANLSATPAPLRLPLPQKVSALIERRLERISARALKLLRVMAVMQDAFRLELAASVLGEDALALGDVYAELEHAQMIRGERLAHDLLLETALATMPAPTRQLLHRRTAAELTARGAQAHTIARHYLDAGDTERALPWLLQAGQQIVRQGRPDDAVGWLEQVARQAPDTSELRVRALITLGDAYRHRSVEESQHALDEALTLSRREGFVRPEVWALAGLADLAVVRGDQTRAQQLLETAVARVPDDFSDAETAQLLDVRFNVAVRSGDLVGAEAALETSRQRDPDAPSGQFALALLHWHRGDFRSSARGLEHLAQHHPDFSYAVTLHNNLGMTYWALGEPDRAEPWLRQSLRTWLERGAAYQEALSRSNLGLVYTSLGRYQAAFDELSNADAMFAQQGSDTSRADVWQRLGMLAFWTDRHTEARSHHQAAFDLMQQVGDPFRLAYIEAVLALTCDLSGDPDTARHHIGAAKQRADRLKHPLARIIAYQADALIALRHRDPRSAFAAAQHAAELARDCHAAEQHAYAQWLASFAHPTPHDPALRATLADALTQSQQRGLRNLERLLALRLYRLSDDAAYYETAYRALTSLQKEAPRGWFSLDTGIKNLVPDDL